MGLKAKCPMEGSIGHFKVVWEVEFVMFLYVCVLDLVGWPFNFFQKMSVLRISNRSIESLL